MCDQSLIDSGSYLFVGIGGISMSALAKYVLSKGKKVVGYDAVFNDRCAELHCLGVNIYTTTSFDLSGVSTVVYSDAFSDDFCLVARAKEMNIKVISALWLPLTKVPKVAMVMLFLIV